MLLPKRVEDLPAAFHTGEVEQMLRHLQTKRMQLVFKRVLDVLLASFLLVLVSPVLLIVALIVKCTSRGPVFYRQTRVGKWGREFRIFKFRTMVANADKIGTHVTAGKSDPRITRAGRWLRASRLDEFPQLINVWLGNMTFVGARPEVPTYVRRYEGWMMPTLLVTPGITGQASIAFRNECDLLEGVDDVDEVYVRDILPVKCRYNLDYLEKFSIWLDLKLLIQTVGCVFH